VIPNAGEARQVVHYLGNVGMTGVETFLLTLCAAQKRGGLVPSIICDVEAREELVASAAAIGVEVHRFPLGVQGSSSGAARKIVSATHRGRRVHRMGQLLSDTGTDVLHVHPVGIGGLDAFLAARRAGVPFVVTHHATLAWFEPFRTRLSDLTFWFEKHWAARIVCPYRAARDEMVAHGVTESRAAVVPFCVDPRKFDGEKPSDRPIDAPFRLLFVARLIDGKGHLELLRAVARLRYLHAALRVVIVGDGPARATIEAEVERLALSDVVTLLGHVANEKVPHLMRDASAVVLPSYMPGETFPLSLLEAMAMRLPTIGSRWFGIPDIIAEEETGLLVEPRDELSLAKAIERLVTVPDFARKLGENGYARAMKLFTSDAVAATYARIYDEAAPSRLSQRRRAEGRVCARPAPL
jgi:glycosyltransferase involved in cell wall biosynthesis